MRSKIPNYDESGYPRMGRYTWPAIYVGHDWKAGEVKESPKHVPSRPADSVKMGK